MLTWQDGNVVVRVEVELVDVVDVVVNVLVRVVAVVVVIVTHFLLMLPEPVGTVLGNILQSA